MAYYTIDSGTRTEIIECSCLTEHVKVVMEYEVRMSDDVNVNNEGIALNDVQVDQSYELAFFGYGHVRTRSFWNKLKQCFRLMKKGTPYADMVILNKAEALKLANFILNTQVSEKPTQIYQNEAEYTK